MCGVDSSKEMSGYFEVKQMNVFVNTHLVSRSVRQGEWLRTMKDGGL